MKNTNTLPTSQKEKKTVASLAIATSSVATRIEVKKPVRRRRRNYAKKIMNDPFIMTV